MSSECRRAASVSAPFQRTDAGAAFIDFLVEQTLRITRPRDVLEREQPSFQHVKRIAPQSLCEGEQLLVTLSTSLNQFYQARTEGRASGQIIIDDLLKVARQTSWLKKSRPLIPLFRRAIDTILSNENDSLLKIKTRLKMKWFEYRASG